MIVGVFAILVQPMFRYTALGPLRACSGIH